MQTLRQEGLFFQDVIDMRRSALFLFVAALMALFAGGWPLVSRLYEQQVGQYRQQALQQQLQQRAQAQRAELQLRKPDIMAELSRLQAAGAHQEVLALAARYRLADDADIRAVHARSAQQLSLAQTLDRLAELAGQQCTEDAVRGHLEDRFAEAEPSGARPDSLLWQVKRLEVVGAINPIKARLRTWQSAAPTGHDHAHASASSTLELLRGDHTPRLHPAVAFSILQGAPVDRLICVWRVQGRAALGPLSRGQAKPFDLILWMAPSATERTMEYDVLSARRA